jgi:hypothetical protein
VANPLCCAFCHFKWEEDTVFAYLPETLRRELLAEHAAIKRCGFPPALVKSHGERELVYMRMFCPPEISNMVSSDHEQLDKHQIRSATCCCKVDSA